MTWDDGREEVYPSVRVLGVFLFGGRWRVSEFLGFLFFGGVEEEERVFLLEAVGCEGFFLGVSFRVS